MNTPEQRIQVIHQSMRCFFYSLWGLIPILGIVPAIKALLIHRHVRLAAQGVDWNPAQSYLTWGKWVASFVIVFTLTLLVLFILGGLIALWLNDGVPAYGS